MILIFFIEKEKTCTYSFTYDFIGKKNLKMCRLKLHLAAINRNNSMFEFTPPDTMFILLLWFHVAIAIYVAD